MKQFLSKKTFLILTTTMGISSLHQNVFGQAFQVTNRNYGDLTALQTEFDTLFDALETQVNSNEFLQNIDPDTYLKAIANATVAAGGGVDADYASPFSFGLIGFNVGLAADLAANASLTDLFSSSAVSAVEGAGAQGGILLGINGKKLMNRKIGFIDLSKMKGFLSFFAFGFDTSQFSTSFKHFGITGQYKIMDEKSLGFGLLKWGGLDVTAGLKYNNTQIGMTQTLDPIGVTQTLGGVVGDVTTSITPVITAGANVGIFSIPLEVSSYARVLYFLTFFGGMGMDIAFGSASNDSSVEGEITMTSTLAPAGTQLPTADAALDLGSSQSPGIAALRAFGGIQFELYLLSITAQINKSLLNESIGATIGAKLFF